MKTAHPAPEDRPVTLEEFRRMAEEDAHRVELSRGRVVREPRPGGEHGWLAARLVRLLGSFAEEHDLGLVVTETGFLLAEDPPTIRGPDAAFIARERLHGSEIPTGWWKVPPSLAVEVVSPANTMAEIQEKVLEYLEAGTERVWVIEPRSRAVTVWRPPARAEALREEDTLEGEDLLPGFRLEVAALFRR